MVASTGPVDDSGTPMPPTAKNPLDSLKKGLRTDSRRKFVENFFVLCVLYQFLIHVCLSLVGQKDQLKPIFDYLSPYAAFVLFATAYLPIAALRGRHFLVALAAALVILTSFSFFKHWSDDAFLGNSIKSIQYFYGVVIVFIGSVAILEISRINAVLLSRELIRKILIFASIVTIYEFLVLNFVFDPASSFFYKYLDVIINDSSIFRIRPVGIALYAQPNSVFLVYLLALYMWHWGSISTIGYLGILAVAASMGGTGISSLAMLILMRNLKLSWRAVIGLSLVFAGVIAAAIFVQPIAEKFDLRYLAILLEYLIRAYDAYLANFTPAQIVWGTSEIQVDYSPGVTHDWAYFDVFYEYGLIGLLSYFAIYFFIISYALPRNTSRPIKWLIVLFFFGTNFHYSALNYYSGQLFFGIVGAIGYYRKCYATSLRGGELAALRHGV